MTHAGEPRWDRRPRAAAGLRAAILLTPPTLAVGLGWLGGRALPDTSGRLVHAAVVLTVSTAALLVLDRLARRLIPLARLLDVSLLFPDRVPSRFRVARDAARRRSVEEQLRRVAAAPRDPGVAAREILTLIAALDRHDRPTRGHAERVRLFTDLIAEEMHLPQRDRDRLRWAALLHDIGKLTVSATLLNKTSRPDDDEWRALQAHPAAGAAIAAPLMDWLGEWGSVIEQHHERYDGSGYPHGLAGQEIGLGARIVAVADALDVMTAVRAYRRPVSRAAAYRELVRCADSQFDPDCVRAMVSVSVPRLRRAQGVLAWLGDVPVLATHTVPATTLARAVGAGAVVVAGPGLGGVTPPSPALTAPHAPGSVVGAVAPNAGARERPPATHPWSVPRMRQRVDGRASPGRAANETASTERRAAAPDPTSAGAPPGSPGGSPSGSAGPDESGGGSGSGSEGGPGSTVDVVEGLAGEVTGTVGGTVGTVGGTVGDAAGAVGGVVEDTTNAVGGAVGGLLG